jgi:hypothetical protein
MDSYANEELDHAADAMALLWRLSREEGDASRNSEETVSHLGYLLLLTCSNIASSYPLVGTTDCRPFLTLRCKHLRLSIPSVSSSHC